MSTYAAPLAIPVRDLRRLVAALALAVTASLVLASAPTLPSLPTRGVSWGSKSSMVAVDPSLESVAAGERVSVVVQARPGMAKSAARAVSAAGGSVGVRLPIVEGFEASVTGTVLDAIEGSGAIVAVTRNREGAFETITYDTTAGGSKIRTSGVDSAWSAGNLGAGVGVAVIDTGVSEMNDLKGRIVFGPDLSGEERTLDSYGHGTVMAGIIAGSGADSGGVHAGVAPEANIVSVKVAGRNGAADVTTLLQAMHWVAAYRTQFNIRVLNLAWGTPSTQSHTVDPLNYAVQELWKQGIVVVVAAGNSGPVAGTILKPADDPMVVTVGAINDKQTAKSSDDTLTPWSSRGPTKDGVSKPDVVAPGRTIISPRAYGSKVEAENAKALVSPSYIKGSGTSQAAAVTSGVAALLIAKDPSLTPDQVKAKLIKGAVPLTGPKATDQGAGVVNYTKSAAADVTNVAEQPRTSTALGSIEASRGGMNVATDCGNDGTVEVISGEIDVRCEPWSGSSWTGSSWTGSSWTGSSWTGSSWTGSSWTGSSWTGSSWTGSSWTGSSWTGSSWTGSSWTSDEVGRGGTWTGSSWTGSSWTGGTWMGSSWTGSSWTDAVWSGSSWTGSSWTGSSWTGSSWTGSSWTGSSWTGSSWTGSSWTGSSWTSAFWGSRPEKANQVAGEPTDAECAATPTLTGC